MLMDNNQIFRNDFVSIIITCKNFTRIIYCKIVVLMNSL